MKSILLLIGILSFLWIFLLWIGLPQFKKKFTIPVFFFSILLIGSRLLRLYPPHWKIWSSFVESKAYYYAIILPTTAFFITMLISLVSSPLWVLLGRLARKTKKIPRKNNFPTELQDNNPTKSTDSKENNFLKQGESTTLQEEEFVHQEEPPTYSRRKILSVLSWAGPGAALFVAGYGVGIESQRVNVRRLKLEFPDLPHSLQGFKIGQITDSHISYDFTLIQTLEHACDLLSKENLDLLVTTGDLCDHRPQFSEVTKLISQIPTRLGHYACLGNHELHVGLKQVRKAHQQSGLHLLENECIQLGDLTLAGINYPNRGNQQFKPEPSLFSEFLQKTLPSEHQTAFTLLLSHHPHVIERVPNHPRTIDFILSGHMHGGQIGIGERSLIEPLLKYTRGLYEIENHPTKKSKLFVSNGMGHWLPFRFQCPPEVVVIELTKQGSSAISFLKNKNPQF